jgi:predicted dehydrogenase
MPEREFRVKPLRLAVIGTGHLGKIHVRLARSIDDVALVAAVDPGEANRREVAEKYGVPTFENWREVLPLVDAAIIATPTLTHHEIAAEALKQGVHVFVEKPITLSSREARELVDLARRQQCVLQVGHVERFNAAFAAAEPHLSQPRYIEALRSSGYTFRSVDVGVVHDLMIHDLDLVLTLADSPVVDVKAIGIALFGPHEDMAQARIEFANGCVANLSASRTSFQASRTMQCFCERAYAKLDFAAPAATLVRPNEALLRREVDVHAFSAEEKAACRDRLFQDWLPMESLTLEPVNAILDEQQDFVTSIRSKRDPRVTGEHGLRAVETAERILDAIADHRWSDEFGGPAGPHAVPRPSIARVGGERSPVRKAG